MAISAALASTMSAAQLASPFTLRPPPAASPSPPPFSSSLLRRPYSPRSFPRRLVSASAAEEPSTAVAAGQEGGDSETEEQGATESEEDFEARLAKIQRKLTSGSGKKAERRKARKSGEGVSFSSAFSSSSSSKGGGVLLPPVPLSDPISDGLPVALGFNSYTERTNGRFAALGLAAFLLVELATGGSFLKYHESAVIGLQAYFMLAVSAVFIKYEKEKKSIWPES